MSNLFDLSAIFCQVKGLLDQAVLYIQIQKRIGYVPLVIRSKHVMQRILFPVKYVESLPRFMQRAKFEYEPNILVYKQ